MFTKKNLEQIQNHSLNIGIVEQQLDDFKSGFPPMRIVAPATPGDGIKMMSDGEESRYISIFESSLSSGLRAMKFVPASGAASRMFKQLFEYLEKAESNDFIERFFENIDKFAFYDELSSLNSSTSRERVIETLLNDEGMGYGNKPKGLLTFHRYGDNTRTSFEEHLVEAALYCTEANGHAKVHFTISPEHKAGFQRLFESVRADYQNTFGIEFDVSFSYQHPSTDTIAADMHNNPFRDENGDLVFRPGGHGALIQNLSELDSDLIFIKNIDNVVPDRLKDVTKKYKNSLAGILVELRNKTFDFLNELDKNESDSKHLLVNIEQFLKNELCIRFDLTGKSDSERIDFFRSKLNRPIRVCGMVKNKGEPGGGPFWAVNHDETISLQIVEKAQIDADDPEQLKQFENLTHFNPVDLICSTKNYQGEKFDLLNYRDPRTGFISVKSKDGKEMKALELPGLWNGAMSDWNTVFVEVPIQTFNPVKTVNDLLREEHQQ